MLGLAKKIVPFTYANFSKIKANQFGLNKPPGALKPAPPGLKKLQTPNTIGDVSKINKQKPNNLVSPFANQERVEIKAQQQEVKLSKKHPVITIMGHVDHGKTTLIDYLRNSDIAQKEDGGITQKIGAFRINFKGERITFIDTPGHQAFTNMRKRGATMTDLVVLVVSAVEGVKKQTLQVIDLIKKMELRVIVAINKIDLPQADPEEIEKQINNAGLKLQPLGGDIPVVHISAKTGLNVELLCELIQEQTKQLMAVFEGLAQASVLQANQTKDGLNSMTIIIQKGILKVNSLIIMGRQSVKVKNILCDKGESLKEAYPGQAVQIIGVPFIPAPGDQIFEVENDKKAKFILDQKKDKMFQNQRNQASQKKQLKASVKFQRKSRQGRRERRAFFRGVQQVWMTKFAEEQQKIVEKIQSLREKQSNPIVEQAIQELQLKLQAHKRYVFEYLKNTGDSPDTLNFIMKFADRGMEETILMQLEKLKPIIQNETKVKLNLIKTDVGEVTTGDIEEAENCSAKIFTFGIGISMEARSHLKEGHQPRTHKLIHNLLADIKETSFKKKIGSIRGNQRGRCEVAQVYRLKIKKGQSVVPGIKVLTGKISRQYKCYIFRSGIPISKPFTVNFLKAFKKDMMEIKKGQEGTVGFSEQITDIEKGDEIVCFEE